MKNKFIRFLKDNDIYDYFIDNFNFEKSIIWRKHRYYSGITLDIYLTYTNPHNFILYAFPWILGPDGISWSSYSGLWRTHIQNKSVSHININIKIL